LADDGLKTGGLDIPGLQATRQEPGLTLIAPPCCKEWRASSR